MIGNERGFGDRFEMPEESFLARLVVIRRNEQRAIDSEFLGAASYRRPRAASSLNLFRQAQCNVCSPCDCEPDDLFPFVVRQRR